MRVGFSLDVNIKEADPGKHKFFIRLAEEMRKRDIKISNKKLDIYVSLHIAQFNKKAKLNVLRLDNIALDKRVDPKNRNKRIIESIKQSDAIIYQNNFSKEVHNRVLGVKDNKKFRIIPNGASPDEFLPRNPKNYFLSILGGDCKSTSLKFHFLSFIPIPESFTNSINPPDLV